MPASGPIRSLMQRILEMVGVLVILLVILRFSLGRMTREEDVDRVLETLPVVVGQLRDLSPRYKEAAAAS